MLKITLQQSEIQIAKEAEKLAKAGHLHKGSLCPGARHSPWLGRRTDSSDVTARAPRRRDLIHLYVSGPGTPPHAVSTQ